MSGYSFVAARPVLGCAELGPARAFWCDLLGFAPLVERPGFVLLRGGDAETELRVGAPPGRIHLQVRGVEALHAKLVEAGRSPGELHTHESARRTFEVADPDGNGLVAAEAPRHGGRVAWVDLTVRDATEIRDFWQAVVGFDGMEPVPMGDYQDFVLQTDGRAIAGVCHQRGVNADLPPVWMVSFTVDDLERALDEALARGGTIASRHTRMAFVRDPAGAIAALYGV